MLLRPLPNGLFTVVGECFVYGLNDGIALLGPFPEHWRVQILNDFTGQFGTYRFFNAQTGALSDEDPRLGPLRGWERMSVVRTGDDPATFQCFRNNITGEVIKSDPRVSPEGLAARGVGVTTFSLV